jgi:hypothetical protein
MLGYTYWCGLHLIDYFVGYIEIHIFLKCKYFPFLAVSRISTLSSIVPY